MADHDISGLHEKIGEVIGLLKGIADQLGQHHERMNNHGERIAKLERGQDRNNVKIAIASGIAGILSVGFINLCISIFQNIKI